MRKLLTSVLISTLATFAFGDVKVTKKVVTPAAAAGHVLKTGDSMTGRMNITAAEFLLDLENTTDAASNEIGRFYSNRATPTDGDDGFFSLRLNNAGGVETEFIRQTWQAVVTDGKAKGSLFKIEGFKGNVFTPLLILDADDGSATFDDAVHAFEFTFLSDPELDTNIRGVVDNEIRFRIGGTERASFTKTVANFNLLQLGVGAGSAFNPIFKVASTTLPSHPIPNMSVAQRGAIASPEVGDFVITPGANLEIFDASAFRTIYRNFGLDVQISDGGTGESTKTDGFDALSPTTTKGDITVHNGTDNIRLPIGTNGQVLEADSGEAAGLRWMAPSGITAINVLFSGNGTAKFTTSSESYVSAGIFIFEGTTALGTPTNIKAIGSKDASPTAWDFRIFDLTNSLEIAELTGSSSTTPELVDSGSLSNLPTGEAMFEVQLKRTGGTGGSMVNINSVALQF